MHKRKASQMSSKRLKRSKRSFSLLDLRIPSSRSRKPGVKSEVCFFCDVHFQVRGTLFLRRWLVPPVTKLIVIRIGSLSFSSACTCHALSAFTDPVNLVPARTVVWPLLKIDLVNCAPTRPKAIPRATLAWIVPRYCICCIKPNV